MYASNFVYIGLRVSEGTVTALSCVHGAGVWGPFRYHFVHSQTMERARACIELHLCLQIRLSSMCTSAPKDAASETCATIFTNFVLVYKEHLSQPRARGGYPPKQELWSRNHIETPPRYPFFLPRLPPGNLCPRPRLSSVDLAIRGPLQDQDSPNTFLKISLLLYRFRSRSRSLSRCALSLPCPHGRCAAWAPNSFSRKRIAGMEPPSRM